MIKFKHSSPDFMRGMETSCGDVEGAYEEMVLEFKSEKKIFFADTVDGDGYGAVGGVQPAVRL